MRTAGALTTAGVASTVTLHDHAHCRWRRYPRFCECGTCVTARTPRWCIAAEVTDNALQQNQSLNDKPNDTCTETACDGESGTTMVSERDGQVPRRHVRR